MGRVRNEIELLAPGGDIDSIKAAIVAGADAVYCGLTKFNARNRAANIAFENLNGILRLAHQHTCAVYLTLNISFVESEIPYLFRILSDLVNTSIDGIIIQDLGLFYLLSKYFERLRIHASTQLTTHNEGQVRFLEKLGAKRVNLSRELDINEIKSLTAAAHKHKIETEVFVHGSYCVSFSGICYMSSLQGGNSGNRGRCSQPCRDAYVTTPAGSEYPLNLKDNSAFYNLQELAVAGVDSLKIEGRIKKYHYVYTVVDTYKRQLQAPSSDADNSMLYVVFNRDFSNAYLTGDLSEDMFTGNARDNSATHFAGLNGSTSNESIERAKKELLAKKADIRSMVRSKIDCLRAEKAPVRITVSGQAGEPLQVKLSTPSDSFSVLSKTSLVTEGAIALSQEVLLQQLKAINDTEYFIDRVETNDLKGNLYLPLGELTSIKKRILFVLNDARQNIPRVSLPKLKKSHSGRPKPGLPKPKLMVLISSILDLHLCDDSKAQVYFQLPSAMKVELATTVGVFEKNENLTPWFPSVLIGEDFDAAIEFLCRVRPKQIVTNNSGVAYHAYREGVAWIAGPNMNVMNSYGLLCLKEEFNCTGSFVSNELNRLQIKFISRPDDFHLYFSIFHPIELMTSRQCLFHQITGCHKNRIDADCIPSCAKSASFSNLKNETLYVEKSKGNYNYIYNAANYLNTDIVSDVPDLFSGFLVDLRNIKTSTEISKSKVEVIGRFEELLRDSQHATQKLMQEITPTTMQQYKKGI